MGFVSLVIQMSDIYFPKSIIWKLMKMEKECFDRKCTNEMLFTYLFNCVETKN